MTTGFELVDDLYDLWNNGNIKNDDSNRGFVQFSTELYNELGKYIMQNKSETLDENQVYHSRMDDDDFPSDKIPFVVVKKKTTFIEYKCPYCKDEGDKISISAFENNQFVERECPTCGKKFLCKLEFNSNIKTYGEI